MPWLPVPGERPLKERDGVDGAVGGEHLGVGEPGVVVDGDVDVLPAGARAALPSVAQDALTDVPEAAELLGVDVQEFSGTLALVAHHRRAWLAR